MARASATVSGETSSDGNGATERMPLGAAAAMITDDVVDALRKLDDTEAHVKLRGAADSSDV